MSYLIPQDYLRQIQDTNLQQIISADTTILDRAQLAAEAEALSYLRQKYDTSAEFTNTTAWSDSAAYGAGDRVYQDVSNVITLYYAAYPQPPFVLTALYSRGDQTFYKGKVYTCLQSSQPLRHNAALEYGQSQSYPAPNAFPGTAQGLRQWGNGVAYAVAAGTLLTNTDKWTKGDNRDQQLVMALVDIALYHVHSRIAPRNIPDLRTKRYDAAVEWLKMCADGSITPALPVLQPRQGARIRFGSNTKNINSY